MTSPFSAGPQALGYLYQARRGLLSLLKSTPDSEVVIEGLDDIAVTSGQGGLELEQLKHHISNSADLTDSSPDLWKTLRVWSTYVAGGSVDLAATKLSLITTGNAAQGSIASLLRDDDQRDEREARRRLVTVAKASTNSALAPAFASFLALSDPDQQQLVAAFQVNDASPNILAVEENIKKALQYATYADRIGDLYERLEGWWFAKIARHLMDHSAAPIPWFELSDAIRRIAETLEPDSLTIDFLTAIPDSINVDNDTRRFVLQLKAVTANKKRIERAIIDYYRAYEQRSRWLREELLLDAELEEYETRLVDEWERYQLAQEDECRLDRNDQAACDRFGVRMLNWMENEAEVRIRPKVTEGYVMRGSYHVLADRENPRVWWHPHFLDRLQDLLSA